LRSAVDEPTEWSTEPTNLSVFTSVAMLPIAWSRGRSQTFFSTMRASIAPDNSSERLRRHERARNQASALSRFQNVASPTAWRSDRSSVK
jgi:hypothetical protein